MTRCQQRHISANCILHHVFTWGLGQTALLLHGLTDWGGVWKPARNSLSGCIISPDLRGHGLSEKPPDGYALPNLATDVARLIEQLDAVPLTVIGHSLGAVIALYMAVQYPDYVRCLVLVDPPLQWQRIQLERFLGEVMELRQLSYPELLSAYAARHPAWSDSDVYLRIRGLIHFSARCGRGLLIENNDHNLAPMFSRVDCSTLIVAGEQELGGLLSTGEVNYIESLLPKGEATIVRGAGHSVHRDQPEKFWQTAQRFLIRATRTD